MTQRMVVGKMVNTLGFEIDKGSLNRLKSFQKRLANLKKQMKGLDTKVSIKTITGGQGASADRGLKQVGKKRAQVLHDAQVKQASKLRKKHEAVKLRNMDKDDLLTSASKISKKDPQAVEMFKRKFEDLNKTFLSTGQSSASYRKETQQLMRTFRRAEGGITSLNQKFLNLRHNMLGLGIAGSGVAGVTGLTAMGQSFEAMEAKMLAATGGSSQATEAIKLAREQAQRLGTDFLDSADSLARLGIAAKDKMSKSATEDLFVSFQELGTAFKLAPTEMKRGLRAIEQMLN